MSLSLKCFSQHGPGTVWPNMTQCLYVLLWLCYISVSTFGLRTLTRVKVVILSGNYSYLLASFFDHAFYSIFNGILFQFVIHIFSYFIIIIIIIISSSISIFNLIYLTLYASLLFDQTFYFIIYLFIHILLIHILLVYYLIRHILFSIIHRVRL